MDVDVTAGEMLLTLDNDLHTVGIELVFAEMKDPVKDRLKHYGLFAKLGEELFFPTLGGAVNHFLETHQVQWVDWEDTQTNTQ